MGAKSNQPSGVPGLDPRDFILGNKVSRQDAVILWGNREGTSIEAEAVLIEKWFREECADSPADDGHRGVNSDCSIDGNGPYYSPEELAEREWVTSTTYFKALCKMHRLLGIAIADGELKPGPSGLLNVRDLASWSTTIGPVPGFLLAFIEQEHLGSDESTLMKELPPDVAAIVEGWLIFWKGVPKNRVKELQPDIAKWFEGKGMSSDLARAAATIIATEYGRKNGSKKFVDGRECNKS